MFMLFECSGLPQEPSGRWSARRNLMPRLIADLISSGFGGVIGSGLGPWVASGERCGFLVVVVSVSFLSVAAELGAELSWAGMMNAHARVAIVMRGRRNWLRVRIGSFGSR